MWFVSDESLFFGYTINLEKSMVEISALPDYPTGLTFEQVWAALMENKVRTAAPILLHGDKI